MAAAISVLTPKSTTTVQSADIFKQPNSKFLNGCPLECFSLNLKPVCKYKARVFPSLVVSASAGTTTTTTTGGGVGGGTLYVNFTGFPFPLGPFLNRPTTRTEAVKDCMWLFEQEQALGFSSVSTNTRMTVIKLKSGGLWVHAPIAPTKECIQLVKELGAPVEYIVLPTFALEHKIFVGPFSRKFPQAQVYVAP